MFRYISMLFNFCLIGVLEKERRRGVRFKGRIREFKFKIRLIRFRSKEIQCWCEIDGGGDNYIDQIEYREGGEL